MICESRTGNCANISHYIRYKEIATPNVTIQLQDDLIDRLDREAEDAGVSRSEYSRQILRDSPRAAELEEEGGPSGST